MDAITPLVPPRGKAPNSPQREEFDTPIRLPEALSMTVALARDVEDYLQEQVRAGVCADASELINDVIRSVREQQ